MAQKCIPRFPLEESNAGSMARSAVSASAIPTDSIDPTLLSLAMGFVPRQLWETPYELSNGFSRGTIFPGLDKPFCGWNSCGMRKGAVK